jgi:hypothetical protein
MSESWELKQLTAEDLGEIEGLCQPYGAEGSVTLRRDLAVSLLNEVLTQRKNDRARRLAGEGTIWIESLVSMRTGQPLVKIHYGSVEAQLSADEAIAHAGRILEVAAGAHADAFLVSFLKTRVGMDPLSMGAMLKDFRAFREQDTAGPDPEVKPS